MTLKARGTNKIVQLDFKKIENFCALNEIIKKVKIQPIEWEKVFVNPIFNKCLISSIYKDYYS